MGYILESLNTCIVHILMYTWGNVMKKNGTMKQRDGGEEKGIGRRLAGQRGWRETEIKRDAGRAQPVGEQWHERAELEITHCTGTSEEAQNILTSTHTHTHKPTFMHASTHTLLDAHRTHTHIQRYPRTQWETARGSTTKRSQLREHLNTAIITALPTLTDLYWLCWL